MSERNVHSLNWNGRQSLVVRLLVTYGIVSSILLISLQAQVFTSEDHKLSRRFETNLEYQYILTFPPEYESNPDQDWPLILYLHGGGTPKVERYRNRLSVFSSLPVILVAPLCPPSPDGALHSGWHWKMLGELVREVSERHRVDPLG